VAVTAETDMHTRKRLVGCQAAFVSKLGTHKIKIKKPQPAATPTDPSGQTPAMVRYK
jgi:hypothetical protein